MRIYTKYYACFIIEKLSKELLSLGVIKGLVNLLSVSSQNLTVIHMALQALIVLLDYGEFILKN